MQLFLLISTVLGGLALFIFGMQIMTEGLRQAVGVKLQRLLARSTRNRWSGFALGTALGATVHSSATVVMLVGFVNAGLMTLPRAIAPVLGANVGTTLSMQAIAFRISDYAYAAIAVGVIIALVGRSVSARQLGRALLGFGLLFLGMQTMSDAIQPHRAWLARFLVGIDGDSWAGLLKGIGISALLTAVWQSSGATIAILFALIGADVMSGFSQVYPIVLGAHLGTCATGLLGSLGANVEARRCALVHLWFNVFNVLLAVLGRHLFMVLVPLTSGDLVRQTANLHTAVMLAGALPLLPFTGGFAMLTRRLFMRAQPMPQASLLDYELIAWPERGLTAVIAELQRVSRICAESLSMTAQVLMRQSDRAMVARVKNNEMVINAIKQAVRQYITVFTGQYLSRRQIILYHHLYRCMADIERIGDHIDQLCDVSQGATATELDASCMDALQTLYVATRTLLDAVIEAFDPQIDDFQSCASTLLALHATYRRRSQAANAVFQRKVETHEISPGAALTFKEYILIMDRLNRHLRNIALTQQEEDFRIKRAKLEVAAARGVARIGRRA